MKTFNCDECSKKYNKKQKLLQHMEKEHNTKYEKTASYECGQCNKKFTQSRNLIQHLKTVHGCQTYTKCKQCTQIYGNTSSCARHEENAHGTHTEAPEKAKSKIEQQKAKHEIDKFFQSFRLKANNQIDVFSFVTEHMEDLKSFVRNKIAELGPLKIQLSVFVQMLKPTDDTKVGCHANTKSKVLTTELSDDEIFEMVDQMNNSIQIFSTGGSGFIVQKIDHLDININKFKPIRGSSYIATPSALIGNHFLLNIRNNDNKCFAYSVLAAMFPEKEHKQRQNKYKPNLHKLNLDNIEFPMPLMDVPKFEKQNNIGINVFGFEKNKILPLYLSKIKTQKIIPLLLLTDGLTSHYCLITNFHAFMARQFGKRNHNRYKYCERCLHGFWNSTALEKHLDLCGEHKAVHITMPTEDSTNEFTNWHKTFSVPLVIYADTEAVSLKHDTCRQNPENSYTLNKETQNPCAIGFCAVDKAGEKGYYSFEGEKCIEEFFQWLRENAKSISERKQKHRRLIISDEERMRMIDQGTRCVICQRSLNDEKVIHHDHFTGEIYGVAHNSCNMKLRTQTFTPIFFHNLSEYDAHHLLKYIEIRSEGKLTVIPCNSETYISFSFFVPVGKTKDEKLLYEEFRFLDSFRFLSGSLETLVKTLETKDYIQLSKHFPKHVDILQKKGIFHIRFSIALRNSLKSRCLIMVISG